MKIVNFIDLINSTSDLLKSIAALLVAIIALLTYINRQKRKRRPPKKGGEPEEQRKISIPNRSVLLGILLLVIFAIIFMAQTTPEIKITSPKDGDEVPINFTVSGTISGELPNGQYMWIFTYPQSYQHKWWPQGGRIRPQNGQWSMPVWIVNKQSNISIVVALVNKEDNQYLINYGVTGDATGRYPGISPPESAKIVANITVT